MKILAISGSLRKGSSNTVLLRAALKLVPPGVELSLYEALGDIPPFNPDLDDLDRGIAPPSVLALRAALQASDAVLISSPEYAHGVSGVMKNALDWLVGSGEFSGKPTALINVSPRAHHAHASLMEVLRTISSTDVIEGLLTVPLTGRKVDEDSLAADPDVAPVIVKTLQALVQAARPET
ncbi:NAD(P)H-dependent oxidoreductase [Corallococcus sp. CA053C]|uniref:NADPH-dependent FMN reductase n=1 Tax=Corallococcus sp. CA053C TaxID=2316732 RepID=UPI000EA28843|nr:NAD(P)H-dependent oxidoreductase [Corallococcus sp. CA053C]RKH01801.1 NAD(P)H-dependent oxidoreductase [Corallococcus sp. CA053C]